MKRDLYAQAQRATLRVLFFAGAPRAAPCGVLLGPRAGPGRAGRRHVGPAVDEGLRAAARGGGAGLEPEPCAGEGRGDLGGVTGAVPGSARGTGFGGGVGNGP